MTDSFASLSIENQLQKSIDYVALHQNVDYLDFFMNSHVNYFDVLDPEVHKVVQLECSRMIPVLIQAAGNYPEITSRAFHMVARINEIESKLVKTQYFQATLEFLNSFPENEDVLVNCIEAVSMLATNTGMRSTMAQVGILEKIIEIFPDNLHRSDLIVMFLKCFVNSLYTLLGNKLIFIEEDGVGFIIDILNESSIMNDSNIIFYGTLVLRNALHLDRKDFSSILDAKHPRITQQILSLLKLYSSNCDAQINLLWSLTNLMHNDVTVKEIICEKDGAMTVLTTLKKHGSNSQLVIAAFVCLNQMAKKKYSRISISAEDGVKEIMSLLQQHEDESEVIMKGLVLLSTLATESTGKKKITESTLLEYAVDTLNKSEDSRVQEICLNLLSTVALGGQSTKKIMKDNNITAVLMESITRFDNDAKLQTIAQDAMSNLFKPADYEEEIIETPIFTDDDIDFSFLLKEDGDDIRNDSLKDFTDSFQYGFESTSSEEIDYHYELKSVQDQLAKEQREKSMLEQELQSLRQFVLDMNNKNSKQEEETNPVDDQTESIEKYKKRATALEERYLQYKAKARELESAHTEKDDLITQSQEKKQVWKQEALDAQQKIKELEKLYSESMEEVQASKTLIDNFKQEIESHENDKQIHLQRIQEFIDQQSRRETEFELLEEEVKELQQTVSLLTTKERRLLKDNDELANTKLELLEEKVQLIKENEDLAKENAELIEEKAQLLTEKENLSQEIATLKSDSNSLEESAQQECVSLRERLEQQESLSSKQKEFVLELEQEKQELTLRLEELSSTLKSNENDNSLQEKMQQENIALQERLQEELNRIEKHEQVVLEMDNEKQDLIQRVEELESRGIPSKKPIIGLCAITAASALIAAYSLYLG